MSKCKPECRCDDCEDWRRRAYREVTACEMPTKARRVEADIYRGIRDTLVRAHCVRESREHPCAGAITITSKHITMNCKLCGDARQIIVTGDAA